MYFRDRVADLSDVEIKKNDVSYIASLVKWMTDSAIYKKR